ncbi:hypothetical protein GBAR_LOCUS11368, partial [Geodia barretti]
DILDELYSDKSTTAVITKILQLNNQSLVFPGIQLCKLTRDAFLSEYILKAKPGPLQHSSSDQTTYPLSLQSSFKWQISIM